MINPPRQTWRQARRQARRRALTVATGARLIALVVVVVVVSMAAVLVVLHETAGGRGSAGGANRGGNRPAPSGATTAKALAGAASGSAQTRLGVPFPTRCAVQAALVPDCGVYWGIYSRRFGEGDVDTSVTSWESMLGRRFDIVLMYYDFSGRLGPGQFPDRAMAALAADRIPLFDWETRDYVRGTYLRWSEVAAGAYDRSVVIPEAQRIKAFGRPVMLGLDHEMDTSYARHGSPADYRAMYRHVREVFAAQGVDNVVWTWVTTGWLGDGTGAFLASFYPGDDLVDWIGYDPYNAGACHGGAWKTFEQTISPFYRWTQANGLGDKPLLLQEYGVSFDPRDPAASRQWYRDVPSVLPRYPRLKALVRWDSDTDCELRIDNGPGMVDAFKAAGLAVPRP